MDKPIVTNMPVGLQHEARCIIESAINQFDRNEEREDFIAYEFSRKKSTKYRCSIRDLSSRLSVYVNTLPALSDCLMIAFSVNGQIIYLGDENIPLPPN
ncbi:unnamed protein product [Schistosoma turkestanicum]|nr:unnamed protein product [Schistosoma turkestanicum]